MWTVLQRVCGTLKLSFSHQCWMELCKKTSTAASIGRGTAYTKRSTYTQIYKYNIHRYTYLIIFKHTYVYKYSQIHTLCCKNKKKIPFTFQVLNIILMWQKLYWFSLCRNSYHCQGGYFDWNFLRYTVFPPSFSPAYDFLLLFLACLTGSNAFLFLRKDIFLEIMFKL